MVSSNNFLTMELPRILQPTFADPWLSESFYKDAEIFTKALQQSVSNQSGNLSGADFKPFFKPETTTMATPEVQTHTPTVSGGSTESEAAMSKRRKTTGVGVNGGGKVTKRKSRASKRTTTTFIAADPANFRQMVQQVTGVRFGADHGLPFPAVYKPEPQRLGNDGMQTGFLPTLDTSAFLLNQPPDVVYQPQAAVSVPPLPPPPSATVDDGGSAGGFDFDFFCNFPILESNVI